MEASRWDALKDLFAQAIQVPPDERAAFLDEHCRDDPDKHTELASLLANHEDASSYFARLAQSIFPEPQDALVMQLDNGNPFISHYRILERLGGGGMGIVYKAQDTRLDRTVALKFLPPHLSTSDEAKERFQQEAKAASALDHPNIATIHEIGETDEGHLFIAMTYYPGETLKAKVARGPLPLDAALGYAAQIARGLAKAHAAGIIHRDIKPANVMVTDDGLVKIVDFGLAKIADVQLTQTGARMGTVSYMSPEQARGVGTDHRTDIWSVGVVLYEMLTGERPFKGEYPEAVIYSVLHEEPIPVTKLNPEVTADLESVVAKCLEKDKALRYPTAEDLLADLEVWTKEVAPRPSPVLTVSIAGISVLVTLLVLTALWAITNRSEDNPKRLAVLSAISADSATQVFTNGLVETLTRKLIQLEDQSLWVESSTEVQKNAVVNSIEAFEKFGVNLALIVDTERRDDSIRVTLDLVDALSQESQKQKNIIRPTAARAALTNELVATLADMLDIELTPAMYNVLTAGSTTAPEAEHFYMNGLGNLQEYQETRNIDAAILLFEQAIQNDSSYALAYAGLGEAYWRKFETTKDVHWAAQAERYCDRALALEDLISPTVYVTLGFIYLGRGLPGFAKGAFESALAKEPASAAAYIGLAKAFAASNRVDDAEGAYRRAIELKPDYWASWNALGVFYYNESRYEDAIEPFQQMKALTLLNARGYLNLGATYWSLERMGDAIQAFEEALSIAPEDYTVHNNLATLYFYEGRYEEAARTYEKVIQLQESDYQVWGYLGEAYHWIPGKRAKARSAYERATRMAEERLTLNPRDSKVLVHLTEYYVRLDSLDQARALLEQLASMEPLNEDEMFRIGSVYEDLDERDRALTWIEKAVRNGFRLTEIKNYPGLEDLRADERFQRMLRDVKGDTM